MKVKAGSTPIAVGRARCGPADALFDSLLEPRISIGLSASLHDVEVSSGGNASGRCLASRCDEVVVNVACPKHFKDEHDGYNGACGALLKEAGHEKNLENIEDSGRTNSWEDLIRYF